MHYLDSLSPASGAHCELADLIALRFPARQLQLGRRNRALSALTGPNKSNFRGRGIEFEEVRAYQPGDDIRTIDWRVTARTGSAHTQLFQEERERPVLIAVDQRDAMFFGSRHCFKSVLASHLAALIAWAALEGADRVGGLVFNDAEHRDIRPRRSRNTVLALLSQIATYNSQLPLNSTAPPVSFADMLGKLRRIARPGSSVFIISDFRDALTEPAREQLFQLAQHSEITALGCSDALEANLPRAGRYTVTDGVTRSTLQTTGRQLRRAYHTHWEQSQQQLAEHMRRLGIPLIQLQTHDAPLGVLQHYYRGFGR